MPVSHVNTESLCISRNFACKFLYEYRNIVLFPEILSVKCWK